MLSYADKLQPAILNLFAVKKRDLFLRNHSVNNVPYLSPLKADRLKVNILREMAASLTGKPYLKRVLLVGFPGTKPDQGQLF